MAQLLAEDPTELNKALLTAEAALRRVKRKFGEGTKTEVPSASSSSASVAKEKEEEVKSADVAMKVTCTAGTIWWLEREMAEAKKYKFSGEITVKFVGQS